MPTLRLTLFGSFRAQLDSNPIQHFESDKVRALLTYLAVEAHAPQRREYLAYLLWPDSPHAKALANLRQALANLRKALGDQQAQPPFLLRSAKELQFNPESSYRLDVAEFRRLLAEADPLPAAASDLNRDQVERLQQAATLYEGPFLAQFSLRDSDPFEEWLQGVRGQLQREALWVLAALLAHAMQAGQVEQAHHLARRWRAVEPLSEEPYRQLIRLHVQRHEADAALACYNELCAALAQEGMEPSAETVRLAEAIRSLPPVALATTADPAPQPAPLTARPGLSIPCIGRQRELRRIGNTLAADGQRLLTLIGLGGMGKTRLAVQVAEECAHLFPDGIYFVPLAGVHQPEFLLSALASALYLPLNEGTDPKAQLLNYLAHKRILLLLDSFEHLTEAGPLLVELLQRTAHLKLLVTSRERLKLPEEWSLLVEGLDFPPAGETRIDEYDAVKLFIYSASRVDPDFHLTPADRAHVAAISRLVAGMPLGALLAGASVRLLSCQEIAQDLAQALDLPAMALAGLPERHRNLQAVLSHAWSHLTPDEQAVLCQLSVFQGSFSREMAGQIAGATRELLLALVDKAVLWRNSYDRYEMHDLLRHYASQQLAKRPELHDVHQRHSQCYAAFIVTHSDGLHRAEQATLAEVEQELDNLQAGYRWAMRHGDWATVDCYVEELGSFLRMTNRLPEAVELYTQALARSESSGHRTGRGADEVDHRLRRARWTAYLGDIYWVLGQLRPSRHYLEQAVALLNWPAPQTSGRLASALAGQVMAQLRQRIRPALPRGQDEPARMALLVGSQAYEVLSRVYFVDNLPGHSLHAALRALNLGEQAGPSPELVRAYAVGCLTAGSIPWHGRAEHYSRRALETAQQVDDPKSLAWALELIGIYRLGMGQWERAQSALQTAAGTADAAGERPRWEEVVGLLGAIAYFQGNFGESQQLYQRVNDSIRQRWAAGDAQYEVPGLAGQAQCVLRLGRTEETIRLLSTISGLPVEKIGQANEIWTHGLLALAHWRQGERGAARQLAESILHRMTQSTPNAAYTLEGYACTAEVLLALAEHDAGGVDNAAQAARQAVQVLQRFARSFALGRPRAWLWQGTLAWLTGRQGRAVRAWQTSLAQAEQLAMPYEQGLAHYEWGRHLPAGAAERSAHLNQALTLFREIHADYDQVRVEALS